MAQEQIYLNTAVNAAKKSGITFIKFFGHAGKVTTKNNNPRDLVTKIDCLIEKQIRQAILNKFPHSKIIGEEFAKAKIRPNDLVWIIDPIDGTTNYIQGLPLCCISIGVWNSKGPLISVVYNPILNLLFTAVKDRGAFLNGKKINASNRRQLIQAFGGYGWGRDVNKASQNFPLLIQSLNKIRTLGSSTLELCFVASGIYDFHIQAHLKIWDFAAAALLITEANGKITDWQGNAPTLRTTNLVGSNTRLHSQLLQKTKKLSV